MPILYYHCFYNGMQKISFEINDLNKNVFPTRFHVYHQGDAVAMPIYKYTVKPQWLEHR